MHPLAKTLAVLGVLIFSGVPAVCQVPAPTPNPNAWRVDLNGDGQIDAQDLLLFREFWHTRNIATPTPTGTPTPATGEIITIPLPNLPAEARPLRLVRIPAGTFQMGSPSTERGRYDDEGPVHQVTINYDFYMGETEVTQAQWTALMGGNPSSSFGVGHDYPVYFVSWNDITQGNGFLARLNEQGYGTFRLPSEAEWEYACRAGTTTRFYFGDSLSCEDGCQDCTAGTMPGNRSDYMWDCGNNSPSGSKPVRGKVPNGFGLYDMHGNLWEWCQDYGHDNYSGAPSDGSAWTLPTSGYRVLRGGYWYSTAGDCRSAMRDRLAPVHLGLHLGFRVVLPVSP